MKKGRDTDKKDKIVIFYHIKLENKVIGVSTCLICELKGL